MTGFPMPPGINRNRPPPEAPKVDPSPFSPPVGSAESSIYNSRLTDDETLYIFKKHLRDDQLTDERVLKFILRYLECRNKSQAARDAGFESGRGYQLINRPEIFACIQALTAKLMMKYGYDAGEVIERVKEIAGIDPIVFENPDGSFKTHLSQIPPESRRAIKKFKVKNLYGEDPNGLRVIIGQLIEVELWDKLKSLEMLGREKNIMKETKKIEHDVTRNMAAVLLDSSRRASDRLALIGEVRDVGEQTVLDGQDDNSGSGGSADGVQVAE